MPHDANGTEINVGDKVLIPAEIWSVQADDDGYCNIEVRPTLGRRPDGARAGIGYLNTAQVVKVSGRENALGV